MDEVHEEFDEGGVSRRDALKKMGVTAAGFWAVPVISSFTARAYATNLSPVCSGHDFFCGGDIVNCGTGHAGPCFCDVDTEGNFGCWDNLPCVTFPSCEDSEDCPPGTRCYANTCCGTPVCILDCGAEIPDGLRLSGAAGGATPGGR